MQSWKTLARRTVYAQPPYLAVEQHTVQLPNGRVIDDWPWIVTPDYANVLPVTAAGTYLCLRQTKYGLDGVSWAVVGGYLERGETPLAAAQRELREETGYTAAEWIDLGHYQVDGNRGAGRGHLFLARGAEVVGAPQAGDLETQQLVALTRAEVAAALARGEFRVMAWAATVALALLRD